MLGFKITVYGVNANYDTSTVAKSTLDALSVKVVKSFNCTHINLRTNTEIENVETLSGKLVPTKKVSRQSFDIMLEPETFISQSNPATYTANRFYEDLFVDYKNFFIFFHNTEVINDYPYLARALSSTTVLTHALQVNYDGEITAEQIGGALYKMGFKFTTTYNI